MSKKTRVEKMEPNQQLHTVTGRFNDPLFVKMQKWLEKNGMSANQLLAKAVEKYISEVQTLEPVEIRVASDSEVEKSVSRLMKQHKRALEELK